METYLQLTCHLQWLHTQAHWNAKRFKTSILPEYDDDGHDGIAWAQVILDDEAHEAHRVRDLRDLHQE